MTDWIDGYLTPAVLFAADWSVRLALAIALLAVWLAARPPRQVAVRFLLCRLVLLGGLLLPLLPHCWGPCLDLCSTPLPVEASVGEVPVPSPENRNVTLPPALPPSAQPPPAREPPAPGAVSLPRLGSGQWLVLTLALSWATVTLILAGRLVIGSLWLARLRREATPAGPAALALLQHCREELGATRRAGLATHPAVTSPVLLGGWRPCIVLPPDWEDLPADARRVSLLHELTHLARRDDWARLGEELVRAVFFFHPLVRWLLNRLDGERELLCDAALVRRGIGARLLARTLLDFARRRGAGRPALVPATVLPFFRRVTVLDRIHQLLEDDMSHWSKPPSRCQAAVGAAVVFGLAVALGSAGTQAEPPKPETSAPPAQAAAADRVDGVVKDSDGKPVAGAVVVLGQYTGAFKPRVVRSGADGSFVFAPLPANYDRGMSLVVLAGKEGYAAVRGDVSPRTPFNHIELVMGKAHPFTGSVRDRSGKPVAGAEILFGVVKRYPANGAYRGGSSWGYPPDAALRGTPLESFFFSRTNDRGRFRFTAVPGDKELIFRVRATGLAGLDTAAKGPTGEFFVQPKLKAPTFVLEPEARIDGRVVTNLPGVSVKGLRVFLRGPGRSFACTKQTTTDEAGHFTFDGVNEGRVEVLLLDTPSFGTWTARAAEVETRAGHTAKARIELIEGVQVEGRVGVGGTDKPAPGVRVSAYGPARPATGFLPLFLVATTDAKGIYRFRLPPGESIFLAQLTTPQGRAQVTIPADAKTFTVPPLSRFPPGMVKALDARPPQNKP